MKVVKFNTKIILTALLATSLPIISPDLISPAFSQVNSDNYKIKVAQNLTQSAAATFKKELESEGFSPVEISGPANSATIFVGSVSTKQQAEALLAELKKSSFAPIEIVTPGSTNTSTAPSPSGGTASFYRVLVSTFNDQQQAKEAAKSLTNEGFPLVDIETKDGAHQVLLGRFQNKNDADSLIGDLKDAGFSLSSVVQASGAIPAASNTTLPDLPGAASLSSSEQEKLKNVLSVNQKVERGEASAEEIRQLRQQLSQLTGEMQNMIKNQDAVRQGKSTGNSNATESGQQEKSENGKSLWLGLGALLLAGAAGYFFLNKKKPADTETTSLPRPGTGSQKSGIFNKSDSEDSVDASFTIPPVTKSSDSKLSNKPPLDQTVAYNMPQNSDAEVEEQINSTAADIEAILKNSIPKSAEQKQATQQEEPENSTTSGNFNDQKTLPITDFSGENSLNPGSNNDPIKLTHNNEIYQQNFDSYEAGTKPNEWRGEFEFATLSVQRDPESTRAAILKYVKPTASGSATYHCKFPPAKGFVTAEFEVRCDEKNKYLLGIYLEKDEDFRQSFHTIIQRLDESSPASLRIQGEPVPYEMGTWSKIRFELDLNTGKASSFVNNELVAADITIPNPPDSINTISIRDNLATTGVLYLANIRIVGS